MKKIILLFSLIIFSSCNQSGSRIEVSDEKSIIIQKIFDEVAAERIDYLEDVFSSEMKMVNSKNEEFNKNQFIIGIKDMLDLFDDISFENVNADADGSEIETNYYSNGNVWSSIWNNFSATGKYTGQKVNFPFHISYKWKGDKIIEEYQFFDLMAFENEANARASQNGTNEKVGFVIELSINKDSNVEEVKALLKQQTELKL